MKEQQIAAIYARISKEDADRAKAGDDSESIQNQKLLLIDYATSNGFLVHNIYVDEDMSGFSDRPSFKQMIKDAADGLFNTIICKHQSRFTRDMETVERYIHGYFVEWGIRFISLTDNVDTNVKGNKKARQIYGLINEWYSEDLSENIRAVFRKKMEAGQFLGAFACYGYEKDAKNKHKLVIDNDAAIIVKEIFFLYLEGYGVGSIAAILTQRGIPTPTIHKKEKGLRYHNPAAGIYSEKYGAWSGRTIARILRNEAYTGTLAQGTERKISYKTKKSMPLPKSEWIVIPNNHKPIIETDVFNKVQNLINGRRRRHSNDKGHKSDNLKPHIFAGKLVCADCGGVMQRSGISRDGSSRYVRCTLASKTRKRNCTPHSIRQDRIEDIVKERIRQFINQILEGDSEQKIINGVAARVTAEGSPYPYIKKQVSEISSKISQIQRNIAMAYADKLNEKINEADFQYFKEVFEEEKRSFINKKQYLEAELTKHSLHQNQIDGIVAVLEEFKVMDTLTHEIVNDFIDHVKIGEKNPETGEQTLTIQWII